VLKTVSLVLDYLEEKGLVDTSNPPPHRFSDASYLADPQDNRARVVRELLETERTYIRDLEALQVSDK
jgi:cell division control protein 24